MQMGLKGLLRPCKGTFSKQNPGKTTHSVAYSILSCSTIITRDATVTLKNKHRQIRNGHIRCHELQYQAINIVYINYKYCEIYGLVLIHWIVKLSIERSIMKIIVTVKSDKGLFLWLTCPVLWSFSVPRVCWWRWWGIPCWRPGCWSTAWPAPCWGYACYGSERTITNTKFSTHTLSPFRGKIKF